jgi:hypothetical protein
VVHSGCGPNCAALTALIGPSHRTRANKITAS